MFGKKSRTYSQWEKDWTRFANVPYNIDIVNLGSTADKHNFDYSFWDKKGVNFAVAPQDMYFDNQLLHQYGNHIKTGGVILISISEFALLVDCYEEETYYYKYYGFVEGNRIPRYTKYKKFAIKYFPFLVNKNLIREEGGYYAKKYLPEKLIVTVKKHLKSTYKQIDGNNSLQQKSEKMINSWKKEFGWTEDVVLSEKQNATIERSWQILLDDISFCRKNNLVPVIVIPPFCEHLVSLMPTNILDDCLWKYINKTMQMGINVIDFWNDRKLHAEEYYETPIILNETGRRLFNQELRYALEKIWLNKN